MLRAFGVEKVRVLDGGMRRWVAEGREVEGEGRGVAKAGDFVFKRDESMVSKEKGKEDEVAVSALLDKDSIFKSKEQIIAHLSAQGIDPHQPQTLSRQSSVVWAALTSAGLPEPKLSL